MTGYYYSSGEIDTTGWVPYDGVYPLREEGWLMAPDPEPIEDDDTPLATTDEVNVTVHVETPTENDDDQPKTEEKP